MAEINKQTTIPTTVMGTKRSQKRQCNLNISGLRNQPSVQQARDDLTDSHNSDSGEHSNCGHSLTAVLFDSTKPDLACEELSGDESDVEETSEWGDLDDESLAESLAQMAMKHDPGDHDWIPAKVRKKVPRKHSGSFFLQGENASSQRSQTQDVHHNMSKDLM